MRRIAMTTRARFTPWLLFPATLSLAMTQVALAGSAPEVELAIRNQMFVPATVTIPAGVMVRIMVRNEDTLPAEFESSDFNREAVIPGGSRVPVYVGPLPPGTYTFFDDFHPSTTGTLVVKPKESRQ